MICLQVEQLTKQFGSKTVVNHVSFELEQNTSTALIGPNGAGKTTILSMLTGLLTPSSGSVQMPGVKDIRKEIGFLPQYPKFFPWMTSLEFVEMVACLSDVPKKQAKKEAQRILEFVGLGQNLHGQVGKFSGGMKQRLGLAQALVHQPKLLLLDEPVSALDPIGRVEIMNLLKQIQEKTTILYSTHILNDAEKMTDQVLFLREGQLVEQGLLSTVQSKYNEPKIQIEFKDASHAKRFEAFFDSAINIEQNIGIVLLNDEGKTMHHLLQQIVESKVEVNKIEQVTTSLEEIFMKVVNKG